MRLLTATLVSVLAAYGLSCWLTIGVSPEAAFWHDVMERRDREIAEVRRTQPGSPILFFTGGSSTAFSVDPALIEEKCGLPAFNLGLPISTGAAYIVHQALSRCHSGDILVICLEVDVLTEPGELGASTLSFALASREGDPLAASGAGTLDESLTVSELLSLPRPGPRFLATLAARSATGKYYRYTEADIRYRGRIETQTIDPSIVALDQPVERRLGDESAMLLRQLAGLGAAKGIRLFYSMPWRFTTPGSAEAWRAANRRFLDSVDTVVPVIADDTWGVGTERSHFSDSHQHLSAAGSRVRTTALAAALAPALAP